MFLLGLGIGFVVGAIVGVIGFMMLVSGALEQVFKGMWR